jgi:thymidylate synthase (FAD)
MQVSLIDSMGTDLSIVNAARVSFANESFWKDYEEGSLSMRDSNLIAYLGKHGHWTPFSQTAISLRMKAPIPIRTQCFKHKVGFTENEVSRRYVDTEPEFFHPKWRGKPTGGAKQGSSGTLTDLEIDSKIGHYDIYMENSLYYYEQMIELGVCPEQARLVLPQAVMTEWIWTGSLAAFARFYNLRSKPDSQVEIQELASMVQDVIKPLFPVGWSALTEGG